MGKAVAAKSPGIKLNVADVENFVEGLKRTNPFAVNRVTDPSQKTGDVESIHQDVFLKLTSLAKDACRNKRAHGALLLGGAGVGKSHLLVRFANWAKADNAYLVYLYNIKASPEEIDRYLVKCVITRLAEDRLHRLAETPLFRVVQAAIFAAAKEEGLTVLNDNNRQLVYERLAKRLGGDRDVFDVVFTFFHAAALSSEGKTGEVRARNSQRAALAVRWLQGDLLDAEEALALGRRLPPKQETTQLGTHQVESVILCISRLAHVSNRPLVMCIDQFDILNHEQVSALGKTLHGLIDSATNLVVVVSGVRDSMFGLIDDRILPEATADRLDYKHPLVVSRIKIPDARRILEHRLHDFLVPYEGLQAVQERIQKDTLFPLGTRWFESKTKDVIDVRARDVITWASDAWHSMQELLTKLGFEEWLKVWNKATEPALESPPTPEEILKAIDEKVASKIEESVAARTVQPASLPADAGNLTGLVHDLLRHCLVQKGQYTLDRVEPRKRKSDPLDLIVHEKYPDKGPWKNGVLFVTTGSSTSAAAKLRHLANADEAHLRILVTDEQRMPLPLGPTGKTHLKTLEKLGGGFSWMTLSFDDYARLDALMAVVGLALSGDLEVEPKRGHISVVDEKAVIAAHHRANRYVDHPLLRVFLTQEKMGPPPDPPKFPREPEFREFVLAFLALHMGIGVIEVLRQHIAQAKNSPPLEKCLPNAKEIVLKMHTEGLVSAQPWDLDLFLTLGANA